MARNEDFIIHVLGEEKAESHLRGVDAAAQVEMREAAEESAEVIYENLILFGGTEKLRRPSGGRFHGAPRIQVDVLHNRRFSGRNVVNTFETRVHMRELAVWIERGTGMFGPKHAVIRAKKPKGMFWLSKTEVSKKGEPRWISGIQEIQGNQPKPFEEEAIEASRPEIERIWEDAGHGIARRIS